MGVESNRQGIGARVIATAGALVQTLDVLGGDGRTQSEPTIHYGLGVRSQVERLEIRWPSGRVDVLTDIPADQQIRVFEGEGGSHVVQPTVWEDLPPAILGSGSAVDIEAAVRPALFSSSSKVTQVWADLRALGGPEAVPLVAADDGIYRLETTLTVAADLGLKPFVILIEQETDLGTYWTTMFKQVTVAPVVDLGLFDDRVEDAWSVRLQWLDNLTQHPALDIATAWLEAGRRMAFFTNRDDGNWEVYAMDADGSNPVNLTNDPAFELWGIGASPDGQKIAFHSDRKGQDDIYVMNVDGSNPVNLTNDPATEGWIDWSPDGRRIVFRTDRDGQWEIYVMDADGGNATRFTHHPGGDGFPSWSPDGKRIAFMTDRDGNWEIYALELAETEQVVLDPAQRDVVYDGETALQVQADDGVWQVLFHSAEALDPVVYKELHFAFHPGDTEVPDQPLLYVAMDGQVVDVLEGALDGGIDPAKRAWQEVEIPLARFALGTDKLVDTIVFSGNLHGTCYLDDIRLVSTVQTPPSTAVVEEHSSTVPEVFELVQNFPNPFNPDTAIRFSLPAPEAVELAVYNVAGQRVATLVQGLRQAGVYTVQWDGRDDGGRRLASGVYLYRLRTDSREQTQKLLMLK